MFQKKSDYQKKSSQNSTSFSEYKLSFRKCGNKTLEVSEENSIEGKVDLDYHLPSLKIYLSYIQSCFFGRVKKRKISSTTFLPLGLPPPPPCRSLFPRGRKLSNRELWKLFAMPGIRGIREKESKKGGDGDRGWKRGLGWNREKSSESEKRKRSAPRANR